MSRISQVISLLLISKVPTISKATKVPIKRWKLTLLYERTKSTWTVDCVSEREREKERKKSITICVCMYVRK